MKQKMKRDLRVITNHFAAVLPPAELERLATMLHEAAKKARRLGAADSTKRIRT
jgi:predicted GNAT superfamily acetyltransferase